jgi:hypothetical protein
LNPEPDAAGARVVSVCRRLEENKVQDAAVLSLSQEDFLMVSKRISMRRRTWV